MGEILRKGPQIQPEFDINRELIKIITSGEPDFTWFKKIEGVLKNEKLAQSLGGETRQGSQVENTIVNGLHKKIPQFLATLQSSHQEFNGRNAGRFFRDYEGFINLMGNDMRIGILKILVSLYRSDSRNSDKDFLLSHAGFLLTEEEQKSLVSAILGDINSSGDKRPLIRIMRSFGKSQYSESILLALLDQIQDVSGIIKSKFFLEIIAKKDSSGEECPFEENSTEYEYLREYAINNIRSNRARRALEVIPHLSLREENTIITAFTGLPANEYIGDLPSVLRNRKVRLSGRLRILERLDEIITQKEYDVDDTKWVSEKLADILKYKNEYNISDEEEKYIKEIAKKI